MNSLTCVVLFSLCILILLCLLSAAVRMNVEHDEVNVGLDTCEVDPPHISGLCRVLYVLVYDQR